MLGVPASKDNPRVPQPAQRHERVFLIPASFDHVPQLGVGVGRFFQGSNPLDNFRNDTLRRHSNERREFYRQRVNFGFGAAEC